MYLYSWIWSQDYDLRSANVRRPLEITKSLTVLHMYTTRFYLRQQKQVDFQCIVHLFELATHCREARRRRERRQLLQLFHNCCTWNFNNCQGFPTSSRFKPANTPSKTRRLKRSEHMSKHHKHVVNVPACVRLCDKCYDSSTRNKQTHSVWSLFVVDFKDKFAYHFCLKLNWGNLGKYENLELLNERSK